MTVNSSHRVQAETPVIVFGAFDRHNFGDLLFPHIVSALLPQYELIFAGLAERDLRSYGGHLVAALPALLDAWQAAPPVLLHVGGELLGCDAWEAAVMLQSADGVQQVIKAWHDKPCERQAWAADYLQMADAVPYMVSAASLPPGSRILYNAVGGADLDGKPPAMRHEALTKLAQAQAVGVRDSVTFKTLTSAINTATLLPDPAALTAELFDTQISAHARQGEVATVCASFAQGYLALQFSADFGDEATLAAIADQLRAIVTETGYGLALFRAGAAPWHDDIDTYRRLAARLPASTVHLFESLNIWDICALIGRSRGYCGSSLHGRIVAMAYALPRLNLVHSDSLQGLGKQAAYAVSWENGELPLVTSVSELNTVMQRALSIPPATMQRVAKQCAASYRSGFSALCRSAGI